MRQPIVLWVDEDTKQILIEEYVSVLSGEFTDDTHMELTHDKIMSVSPDDKLLEAIDEVVRFADSQLREHRWHSGFEKKLWDNIKLIDATFGEDNDT